MKKPYLYIGKEEDLLLIKGTDSDVFYFDFETTGLDPFLLTPLLLGISVNRDAFYIINLNRVSPESIKLTFDKFINNLWVAHNVKYELSIMCIKYDLHFNNVVCTMVQEQVIRNGMDVSKSYEATVNRMKEAKDLILSMYGVEIPMLSLDKSVRNGFINRNPDLPYTDEELDYLYGDLLFLPYLHELQEYLIDKYDIKETIRIERALTPVLMKMEVQGLDFDYAKHEQLMIGWQKEKTSILSNFKSIIWKLSETTSIIDTPLVTSKKYENAGLSLFTDKETYSQQKIIDSINFSSQKQIIALLGKVNIVIPDTKLVTLEEYVKLNVPTAGFPLIDALLQYRLTEKMITTYGASFVENRHVVTGKLHPKYSQTFPVTGRLSSSDFNIQNVPKKVRACFKASNDDRVLVTCDLSGQELRIAASQSGDRAIMANFNGGSDLHSILAQATYRIINEDENFIVNQETNTNLRNKHKLVTFGWLYGAGYMRIMKILNVVEHKAKSILNSIQKTMPGLYEYQKRQKNSISDAVMIRDGSFTNRLKWIKHAYCPVKETYKLEKEVINFPIQSTGASMIKLAMVLIDRHIRENNLNWKLLISVHDELLVEIDKENSEQNGIIIKEIMEKAGNYFLKGLKMESSCNILKYWEK